MLSLLFRKVSVKKQCALRNGNGAPFDEMVRAQKTKSAAHSLNRNSATRGADMTITKKQFFAYSFALIFSTLLSHAAASKLTRADISRDCSQPSATVESP